jgi:hypothetical protein
VGAPRARSGQVEEADRPGFGRLAEVEDLDPGWLATGLADLIGDHQDLIAGGTGTSGAPDGERVRPDPGVRQPGLGEQVR